MKPIPRRTRRRSATYRDYGHLPNCVRLVSPIGAAMCLLRDDERRRDKPTRINQPVIRRRQILLYDDRLKYVAGTKIYFYQTERNLMCFGFNGDDTWRIVKRINTAVKEVCHGCKFCRLHEGLITDVRDRKFGTFRRESKFSPKEKCNTAGFYFTVLASGFLILLQFV